MPDKHANSLHATASAIDALRRQQAIFVHEKEDVFACVPVESLDEEQFKNIPKNGLQLVLTGARARHDSPAVRINASNLSLKQIHYLADPLAEKTASFDFTPQPATKAQQLMLVLAKNASLLPALLVYAGQAKNPDSLAVENIEQYLAVPVEVIETAQAKLPLEGAENSKLISFRTPGRAATHLALVIGDISEMKNPKGVLARVHSSCVTGDILGSMRCDCGDQLHLSIEELKAAGNGVLIYLHQEGRGIGITNKLRAYALQEQGVDTYEANQMLGFDEDERDFSIAAAILKKLGVGRIRLLSNNPRKIASLEKSGITITERVPLVIKTGKHNHAYLDAKSKKAGHLF